MSGSLKYTKLKLARLYCLSLNFTDHIMQGLQLLTQPQLSAGAGPGYCIGPPIGPPIGPIGPIPGNPIPGKPIPGIIPKDEKMLSIKV